MLFSCALWSANHAYLKLTLQAQPGTSRKDPPKCKKCGFELQESKMLSMSTRRHEFGRTTRDDATSGGWFNQKIDSEDEDDGAFQQLSLHQDGDSDEQGSEDSEEE